MSECTSARAGSGRRTGRQRARGRRATMPAAQPFHAERPLLRTDSGPAELTFARLTPEDKLRACKGSSKQAAGAAKTRAGGSGERRLWSCRQPQPPRKPSVRTSSQTRAAARPRPDIPVLSRPIRFTSRFFQRRVRREQVADPLAHRVQRLGDEQAVERRVHVHRDLPAWPRGSSPAPSPGASGRRPISAPSLSALNSRDRLIAAWINPAASGPSSSTSRPASGCPPSRSSRAAAAEHEHVAERT